jgi:hypothetical protein
VDLGRFRIGLRVDDVIRAADFYQGLGLHQCGICSWIGRRPSNGDVAARRCHADR